MKKSKPYEIPKTIVLEAYKRVKRNKAAGIDGVDFEEFEIYAINSSCFISFNSFEMGRAHV